MGIISADIKSAPPVIFICRHHCSTRGWVCQVPKNEAKLQFMQLQIAIHRVSQFMPKAIHYVTRRTKDETAGFNPPFIVLLMFYTASTNFIFTKEFFKEVNEFEEKRFYTACVTVAMTIFVGF